MKAGLNYTYENIRLQSHTPSETQVSLATFTRFYK